MVRRVAVIMAVAVMSVGWFGMAQATDYWGAEFAEALLKKYPVASGVQSVLDKLGLYSVPIGESATDQGITITIDRAFSDGGESVLALRFQDEQKRLGLGTMWTMEDILYGPFLRGYLYSGMGWYESTASDGSFQLLMMLPNDQLQGENTRLTFTQLTPMAYSYDQPTGLTLGELVGKQVPGVPEAKFSKVEMTDEGLAVSMLYEYRTGLYSFNVRLKAPDGTIIENGGYGWEHALDRPENPEDVEADDNGRVINATLDEVTILFPSVTDLDAVKDYEVQASYYKETDDIKGKWTFNFLMPESRDGAGVFVEFDEKFSADKDQYHVTGAMIYPSRVVVSYNEIEQREESAGLPDDEFASFHHLPRSYPHFVLTDEKGNEIKKGYDTRYVCMVDRYTGRQIDCGPYDGYVEGMELAECREGIIQCETEDYEHIILKMYTSMYTSDGKEDITLQFEKQLK